MEIGVEYLGCMGRKGICIGQQFYFGIDQYFFLFVVFCLGCVVYICFVDFCVQVDFDECIYCEGYQKFFWVELIFDYGVFVLFGDFCDYVML